MTFRLPLHLAFFSLLASVSVAQPFSSPPRPAVAPLIALTYPNDANGDSLDDELMARAQSAVAAQQSAVTSEQRAQASARLAELVEVELIFKEQIAQHHIDAFLAQGGQITYIYKAVSYGWNGRLPLGKVATMPSILGESLLLLEASHPATWHLDLATRNGRVRPIWTSGFADNPSGFDGDPNITIAILDTVVDESNTKLTVRRVY